MDSLGVAGKIKRLMQPSLNNTQMERLSEVLEYCLFEERPGISKKEPTSGELLERFIAAKRLEGCSER